MALTPNYRAVLGKAQHRYLEKNEPVLLRIFFQRVYMLKALPTVLGRHSSDGQLQKVRPGCYNYADFADSASANTYSLLNTCNSQRSQ